jgi:hypothetical protein
MAAVCRVQVVVQHAVCGGMALLVGVGVGGVGEVGGIGA